MRRGVFLTFSAPERKETFSGVVLNYNEKWVLIRRCADYRLDGYTVFENTGGINYVSGEHEKMTASILKKKRYNYAKDVSVPIQSIDTMLRFITKKYTLLQLESKDGDSFDVVKFIGKKDVLFVFHELTSQAKWRYRLKLPSEELTCISFDNDYLNSLKLLIK